MFTKLQRIAAAVTITTLAAVVPSTALAGEAQASPYKGMTPDAIERWVASAASVDLSDMSADAAEQWAK